MSKVMVGCGAAVVLGAILPWVSGPSAEASSDASGSGLGVWQGWFVLLLGAGLALYAYQGLSTKFERVGHHGWAIAAIAIIIALPALVSANIDEVSSSSASSLEPGAGLIIVFLAGVVAIWPLVVLRRDDKRRSSAAPPAAAGPAPAPPPVAPAAPPAAAPATPPPPRPSQRLDGPAVAPPRPSQRLQGPGFEAPPPEQPLGSDRAPAQGTPPTVEPAGQPAASPTVVAGSPNPAPADAPGPDQSPAPAKKRFCAQCGTEMDPGQRFCAACGTEAAR